ncbi:MAG: DUF211 domain-containing protein [Candidatus Woesearchaeota archaeon]
MSGINYVILDILKPHQPSMLELGDAILKMGKDISVNLRLVEIDEKTETIAVIVKGSSISIAKIREEVEKMGGSIHSVDEVSMGKEAINSRDYSRISK